MEDLPLPSLAPAQGEDDQVEEMKDSAQVARSATAELLDIDDKKSDSPTLPQLAPATPEVAEASSKPPNESESCLASDIILSLSSETYKAKMFQHFRDIGLSTKLTSGRARGISESILKELKDNASNSNETGKTRFIKWDRINKGHFVVGEDEALTSENHVVCIALCSSAI